jgi:hypothetical protein
MQKGATIKKFKAYSPTITSFMSFTGNEVNGHHANTVIIYSFIENQSTPDFLKTNHIDDAIIVLYHNQIVCLL